MKRLNILIITITILLTAIVILPVIAYKIDLTMHDYISILTEFNYVIESSITKFNDFIATIASFIIIIHNQDYQLKKENDYASLLVEFIYNMHDPTTLTTHASNMNIASDMNIQKQESITVVKYTDIKIQFNIDLDVSIKGDDNT